MRGRERERQGDMEKGKKRQEEMDEREKNQWRVKRKAEVMGR